MKKVIFSSLIAMLVFNLCANVLYAQDNKIYNHASLDNPPSYPGGINKFYQWLGENIRYPAEAVSTKAQGIVPVSFTIEKDGSLNDIKIEGRKIGAGLEEEAIRVMKLSPSWIPGTQKGAPVRVKYNIPIKFALKK